MNDFDDELERQWQDEWVAGHPAHIEAKKKFELANRALESVTWCEDPSAFRGRKADAQKTYWAAKDALMETKRRLLGEYVTPKK
jgi:hypothetical protein